MLSPQEKDALDDFIERLAKARAAKGVPLRIDCMTADANLNLPRLSDFRIFTYADIAGSFKRLGLSAEARVDDEIDHVRKVRARVDTVRAKLDVSSNEQRIPKRPCRVRRPRKTRSLQFWKDAESKKLGVKNLAAFLLARRCVLGLTRKDVAEKLFEFRKINPFKASRSTAVSATFRSCYSSLFLIESGNWTPSANLLSFFSSLYEVPLVDLIAVSGRISKTEKAV